jgi:hypothetical protein
MKKNLEKHLDSNLNVDEMYPKSILNNEEKKFYRYVKDKRKNLDDKIFDGLKVTSMSRQLINNNYWFLLSSKSKILFRNEWIKVFEELLTTHIKEGVAENLVE